MAVNSPPDNAEPLFVVDIGPEFAPAYQPEDPFIVHVTLNRSLNLHEARDVQNGRLSEFGTVVHGRDLQIEVTTLDDDRLDLRRLKSALQDLRDDALDHQREAELEKSRIRSKIAQLKTQL